jgi:rhomboid protease GluP
MYDERVFQRKTTGSVVCPSCGSLVGVRDDKCYSCGRANPGLWGFAPLLRRLGTDLGFIQIVVGASTVLYALTLLASGSQLEIVGNGLTFLSPSVGALLQFGASGYVPVFVQGSWWTVLSASNLHGSLLHIVFNMMWVRQLGPVTAEMIGPSRTVIVYTVAGVAGFVLSSSAPIFFGWLPIPLLHGAPFTVGASASIFGLLGALVHYGRKGGSSLVGGEAKRYAVLLFVFGLIMPGVDNFAHAGGFAGGYVASAVMNPLTRERGDHMLAAVGCLMATFLAIVFSVLHSSLPTS